MQGRTIKSNLKVNKYIVNDTHTCFHCGNTGLLNYINKVGWVHEDVHEDEYGFIENRELIEHEDWYLFECPVCHKPVLISEYCIDAIDDYLEIKTEFPAISVSKDGVPKNIYSAFESAVKTKGIDCSICLLSLRRVLEMICKDKKAKGHNLENKLEFLVKNKVLPEMIGDACWIIRQLGNDAAHADKIEVYMNDVEQVIGYLASIIDYLYAMPYRVCKMKQKIENRKQ